MASKNKGTVAAMKSQVMSAIDESRKQADKEMAKAKQYAESSIKKVEDYVRKNPEKAAMISTGIGAALGAALALLVGDKTAGKKGSKK